MATIKALPKFYVLSKSAFDALTTKDSNTLYFVPDAANGGTLYRGSIVYGAAVKYVTAAPEASDCVIGALYVNTTNGLAYVKADASTIKPIGVLTTSEITSETDPTLVTTVAAVKGYAIPLTDKTSAIASGTSSSLLPTVKAVTDYVDTRLASVIVFKGIVDTLDKLPLTGNKKGDMYLVKNDGTDTNVEYVWTSDSASGTLANWEKLGPTVDMSSFMKKVTSFTAGNLIKTDDAGQGQDAGVKAGGSTLAAAPDAATLATEAAVAAADTVVSSALNATITTTSSALDTRITNVSSALNDTITTTSSALDTKITNASSALNASKMDKVTDATSGTIPTYGTGGQVVSTTLTAGGETLAATPTASTLATEKAVAAADTVVSSALNAAITTASSALDSKIDTTSGTLQSAIDSRVIDSGVASGTVGQVIVNAAKGAVKDGGVTIGGSVFAPTSGSNYTSGAVYSNTILATEAAVIDLINELAWTESL